MISTHRMNAAWRTSALVAIGAVSTAILIAVGVGTSQTAEAALPSTVYVSQGGMDVGGCASPSAACASIDYAVSKAAANPTVEVSGQIDISGTEILGESMTVTGAKAPSNSPAVLRETGGLAPVLRTYALESVKLSYLTITGGDATLSGSDYYGGAIYNAGNLSIDHAVISGNTTTAVPGESGGAIYGYGNLSITRSTISGNSSNTDGGAISLDGGTVVISDSTIASNQAVGGNGGGIRNNGAAVTLTDSTVTGNSAQIGGALYGGGYTLVDDTIAGNSATTSYGGIQGGATVGASIISGNSPGNCQGFTSYGYNILFDTSGGACSTIHTTDVVNASPDLGPLADNGGPTATELPGSLSPGIDAIPKGVKVTGYPVCPRTDQRGTAEPVAGAQACTIGAVAGTPTPNPPTSPPPITSPAPPHGYWLVGADGGIFTFGAAQFHGSTGAMHLNRPVVGITPSPSDAGYWLVASDGGLFSFGDAGFHGSIPGLGILPAGWPTPGRELTAPIVGMVPSATGNGYFMVGADGGVFAFGDARFEGSCPAIGGCAGTAVAVMPDATGNGYWLVTTAGNVYSFGDATFYGAPGGHGTATSAVRTPDGKGYWILFSDGYVGAFGDAANLGSLHAGIAGGLNPATAIFATSDGSGYWVAMANGDVMTFGDAPYDGGMAGSHLNAPIIAAVGW